VLSCHDRIWSKSVRIVFTEVEFKKIESTELDLSVVIITWLTLVDVLRNDFKHSTGVEVSSTCSVSLLASLLPPV